MRADPSCPFHGRTVASPFAVVLCALFAAAACLVPASTSRADPQAAAHAVLRDFMPTGKYVFVTVEKNDKHPIVYYSQRAAAYMVRDTPLPGALLLRTGAGAVETVPDAAVLTRADGGCDVRADGQVTPLGRYYLEGSEIVVRLDGLHGRLKAAPPLLGWGKQANLAFHTPEYLRDARGYVLDASALDALRCDKRKVQVFVYFASWCSTCSMLLGRILRLEQEMTKDRTNVTFDYYGLPHVPQMYQDPEVVARGIEKLPTGLVFVDGLYAGRIIGLEFRRPEVLLRSITASPPPPPPSR